MVHQFSWRRSLNVAFLHSVAFLASKANWYPVFQDAKLARRVYSILICLFKTHSQLPYGRLLLGVLFRVFFSTALFLHFIDLVVKLGIGVLVVLVHQIYIWACVSEVMYRTYRPNWILPLWIPSRPYLISFSAGPKMCACLHSLSSVPMNECLSSEQFLELFVRSQEDLCVY